MSPDVIFYHYTYVLYKLFCTKHGIHTFYYVSFGFLLDPRIFCIIKYKK